MISYLDYGPESSSEIDPVSCKFEQLRPRIAADRVAGMRGDLALFLKETNDMKKIVTLALLPAATLALAACGSSDDASADATADTVEMPADEALADVAEEPVEDADANAEDAAAEVADTEATADAAADVAAAATAAAEGTE